MYVCVCVQAVTSGGSNENPSFSRLLWVALLEGERERKRYERLQDKKKKRKREEKTWFALVMVAMIML